MSNPYDWHFPQRNDTMFMATIQSSSPHIRHTRASSFQRTDIPGAQTRQQILESVQRQNFAHSAYIQPVPNSHLMHNKFIGSNSLRTNDIEYAQPQCKQFKTNRVTNPINPRYKLPYVAPVDPEPPRKFIRNSMDISDIGTKLPERLSYNRRKEAIEGSSPAKLFKTVEAVSRLDVKDINRDGEFISARMNRPTNPLEPQYTWRDTRAAVNPTYGDINSRPKEIIPASVHKPQDLSLNTFDIEGAKANSSNQRKYFFQKRKDYRDVLNTTDIPKTGASSLKKGISTGRHVNPLMPQYRYPQPYY